MLFSVAKELCSFVATEKKMENNSYSWKIPNIIFNDLPEDASLASKAYRTGNRSIGQLEKKHDVEYTRGVVLYIESLPVHTVACFSGHKLIPWHFVGFLISSFWQNLTIRYIS